MDIELIRSKLADAYLNKKEWAQLAAEYPGIESKLFTEITCEIDSKIAASHDQLRPREYYLGLGIEADIHERGLLISLVYKDCPASHIGIKANDVITKVNFQTIAGMELLKALRIIRNSSYEDGIIIEVLRNSEIITLGYGINAQPKAIDAQRKYPLNFTALTLGNRIKMLQNTASSGADNRMISRTRPAMATAI